jgi:hypothetical protein
VSSLYSNSNSISQAFLPTHGMRFQGAGDVRVHDWAAARSNTATAAGVGGSTALRQRNADTALAGYPTTTTNTGGVSANGTIPGGMLRPGSIDQTQFKAMLAAAQAGAPGASGTATSPLPAAPSTGLLPLAPNAAMAAQGLQPTAAENLTMQSANAAAGAGGGIQTLTPAQFAALTGGATLPGSNTMAANAALPNAQLQAQLQAQAAASAPPTGGVSTRPPGVQPVSASQSGGADELTMTDAAIPPDGPDSPQSASAAPAGEDSAGGNGKTPTAPDGTPIGSFDKNGVLVLNQAPDRDTRKEYAEKGIKWRLVDNPDSNKLFFGEDGKLGWKDLLDLVNPLQHIPLVNVAYRHFTGDEPSGAAELLGALPFGPLSALTAIADLAVRSTTGKDIGENVIAMVTGDDKASPAANVAQAGGSSSSAGDQLAEVTPDQAQQHQHDNK